MGRPTPLYEQPMGVVGPSVPCSSGPLRNGLLPAAASTSVPGAAGRIIPPNLPSCISTNPRFHFQASFSTQPHDRNDHIHRHRNKNRPVRQSPLASGAGSHPALSRNALQLLRRRYFRTVAHCRFHRVSTPESAQRSRLDSRQYPSAGHSVLHPPRSLG